ncbi:MAG TPA: glycosyltransferase [Chthoniobacterales bacterium]|nr:glycosyltransferase [Chthoniobacterales bacterium]
MTLRLLHAIASADPAGGGPIEGVRQISAINTRYNHEVEIVTLDPPDAPFLASFPYKIHALGPGITSYGFSIRFVEWLRANASQYDAVIVNGVWGFNALGTWLALRKTREVPYMVFTHGMLDPWFKHRYPFKHLKKWLYWPWGLYPVLRDADAVLFTCERERQLARESFWLYDCNEVVVRYGTAGIPDPDADYRSEFIAAHPELAKTRNILFLGRVHPKKGPDLLLKAVAKLQHDGYWDPKTMRIVMAGPADFGYATELKKLAVELGIGDSIYWTGMLSGGQKWGSFQAAEAFILPSHQENFGIAVAEALSARIPVLITHSVNISPDIAVDGAGLVDEDTIVGTQRLLKKWFSLSKSDRDEMQEQARKTFLHRYTSEVAAKDIQRNVFLARAARQAASTGLLGVRLG